MRASVIKSGEMDYETYNVIHIPNFNIKLQKHAEYQAFWREPSARHVIKLQYFM